MKWDEVRPKTETAKWDDIQPQSKPSPLNAIATGANSLVPGILGLPIDTATNIANLGIAGYGMSRQLIGQYLMGETPWEAASHAPEPLGPQAFGSQDIANRINEGLSSVAGQPVDVFSNPRPDSPLAQMLHTGSAVAASGALAPASSVGGALRNVGSMLPSAVGAATAQQIAPDEPLAPALGAIAAPAIVSAARAISPSQMNQQKMATFKRAREAGYRVPPSEVKTDTKTTVMESGAGKAAIRQAASVKNQKVTNRLIAEDLGIPKRTTVTEETLRDIRTGAGHAYKAVKDSGVKIKASSKFTDKIRGLGGDYKAAIEEFPDLAKNPKIDKLVKALTSKKEFSANAAVELSKKLRYDSTKNLKAFDDPERAALGTAQRQAANLIDDLVAENLKAAGKGSLHKDWLKARQTIAKVHDAETAFNPSTGDFDARVFAKLKRKGALSGKSKLVADFADSFPFAAQPSTKTAGAGVNRLQIGESAAFGLGGGLLAGPAGATAAAIPIVGPPALRSLMLSKPYQGGLTRSGSPKGIAPAVGLLSQPQGIVGKRK